MPRPVAGPSTSPPSQAVVPARVSVVVRRGVLVALGIVLALAPAVGRGSEGAPERPIAGLQEPEVEEESRTGGEGLSLEPARTVRFTTSEGTYMNLDVSPDGETLVFDLLGDLYTLPVEGGEATRLTSGMAYDVQPVWSPDGSRVAFISDRSGSDNVWVVPAEGGEPRPVTRERERPLAGPEWAPDGEYLLARRRGELWLYHVDGGSGLSLSEDDAVAGATGGVFSPDGRHVYFSARSGGFGAMSFTSWQVRRLDRVTGDVVGITASPNGAFRPAVSPDGRHMVYGARVDARTGLRLRDLRTDREEWLAFPVDRDNAERAGMLDILPRYDFTPDGEAVIYGTGGTFHRFDLQTEEDTPIRFTADVEQDLGPFVHFPFREDGDTVRVRNLRYVNAGPGADRIVFSALGRIWAMEEGGEPFVLVEQPFGQFQPVLGPGGDALAYVTWDDVQGGHVWRLPLEGPESREPERLTEYAGYYLHPTWSPDGSKIAFMKEDAAAFRNIWSRNTGQIVWIDVAGGPLNHVTSAPSDNRLTFSPDGERLSFIADVSGGRQATSELVSVRLDGTDRRTSATIRAETYEAVPSPDNRWVAFSVREDIYLAALPLSPEPPVIGERRGPGPVKRITREGGIDLHWEDGGETLTWTFADTFYRVDVAEAMAPPPDDEAGEPGADAPDDAADADVGGPDPGGPGPGDEPAQGGEEQEEVVESTVQPDEIPIRIEVPRDVPGGRVALVGGTVITMATGAADEPGAILEDATVLVDENRIVAVGPRDEVEVPVDAEVIDVSGDFVLPGLIDLHAHLRPPREVFVETSWSYLANLAYGVTSTRDVSTSNDSFAYAELVEAGEAIGPRIYSTGRAMTTSNARIEDLDDARTMVRHYKKLGTKVIKQYMQPHRRQRQWVIQAAREEGMNVTNEGAGDLRLNMTQVLDGYTGFEHSLPVADIYDDVIQLVARSRTWYTPTLVVSYGGPTAEWYFYQTSEVHDDEKLSRFTPHDDLDRRTRRGQMYALDEYHFDEVAAGATRILEAGGNVGMGAHGEQQGICAHWEIRAFTLGGMSNFDALRTATSIAAAGLGLQEDLGTVEAGKLADLIVLEADPLTAIENTETLRYVMKNGELFEADTLTKIWPERQPPPRFRYREHGPPEEIGGEPVESPEDPLLRTAGDSGP